MQPLEVHIPLVVREETHISLTVREGGGGSEYPVYTGQINVTPKVRESTILDTQNTVVKQNITVEEIPYYETSNVKGVTFVIGG